MGFVGLTDGKDRMDIDPLGSLVMMNLAHHKIHEGKAYFSKAFAELANGAVIDFRLTVPSTVKCHMLATADTETEYQFHVYEGATITTAGTAFTPRNRNRAYNNGSPDQSSIALDFITNASISNADDDTDITGAIDLYPGIAGSGKKVGGSKRSENELILEPSTIYCFRLHCIAAGWVDNIISWYEETVS